MSNRLMREIRNTSDGCFIRWISFQEKYWLMLLESVTKQIENFKKRGGKKNDEVLSLAFLEKVLHLLETGIPVRQGDFLDDELKMLHLSQFLTSKPGLPTTCKGQIRRSSRCVYVYVSVFLLFLMCSLEILTQAWLP